MVAAAHATPQQGQAGWGRQVGVGAQNVKPHSKALTQGHNSMLGEGIKVQRWGYIFNMAYFLTYHTEIENSHTLIICVIWQAGKGMVGRACGGRGGREARQAWEGQYR